MRASPSRALAALALGALLALLGAGAPVAAGPLEDVAGAVRALPTVLHRVEDVDRQLAPSLEQAGHVIEDVPLTLDGRDVPAEEGADPIATTVSEEQPEHRDVPVSAEEAADPIATTDSEQPEHRDVPLSAEEAADPIATTDSEQPEHRDVPLSAERAADPIATTDSEQPEHRDVPVSAEEAADTAGAGAGHDDQDGSAAPEALHEAREQLQRTLDQVLDEAQQWAQRERAADPAEDEYYVDEEAIEQARAELKHKLEQMLTDTEQRALEEAMEEDEELGDTNGISEAPAPVTKAEKTREEAADVPDDRDDNNIPVELTGRVTDGTPLQSSTTPTMTSSPPPVTSSTAPETTSTTPETSNTAPDITSMTPEISSIAPETTSTAPKTSSTASETTSTTPETTSTAPAWTTEENLWRHLVVPLGESEQRDQVAVSEVAMAPGMAVIQDQGEAVRQVVVSEDVVEAAVAGAAAVHADKQMADNGWSNCPTKLPAPLRLPALPNSAPESLNPQCARDSRLLDLHIRNHTLWAVQMQDAGAGGITGLLEGNVYHLGDFDECMDVNGPVGAQYCVVEVHISTPPRTPDHRHHPDFPADPMQSVWNRIKHEGEEWTLPLDRLHVALCAPSTCGPRDLQDSVQRALNDHAACSRLPVAYTVTVSEALCTSAAKQRPPFTEGEIVYIVLVVVIVLVVLSGTLVDFFATKKKGFRWILVVFSLKRSWHTLTRADPRPMGLNLDPLAGARTVNMVVLVIAHRGFNLMRGPVHNYNLYESMPRALQQTGATHAQLFVDTCFVLSGLLVSLLELTRAHAHGKDSDSRAPLMAALVHRYVRLTPSYAMVVFFYATLFWRLGSGPLWDQVIGHESEACAKYWWTNIFYVNNYINTDKLCMFQSWYLPVDLHLFFIGSAITLLVSRHRRTGLGFLLVFLGLSVLTPFLVTFLGSKPALLEMLPSLFRAPDQSHNFRTMYAPTHIRAAPYMVGLLAGYLFQRLALRHKERFTQGVTLLLCLGGVALTTAALLSSVVFYDPDMHYNGVVSGLYAALCPVVWSTGVCLVFASLVLGSQTIMSTILSWKPLVVLSRLTYNVYLTHWAFQVASVAKARTPQHLDPYNLIYLSFGDMVASFLASLVLFLLVEAPFRSLARKITEAPPESKVHLQKSEGRGTSSSLEAGFSSAAWKHKS